MQGQGATVCGKPKAKRRTGQKHAPTTELLREKSVVPPFAVGGIADDRVGDVFQVTANLVAAPRVWRQFQECVAAGEVAIHSIRQFNGGQAAVCRDGRLGSRGGTVADELVGVVMADERVVDDTRFRRMAPHDGQIALVHRTVGKLTAYRTCYFRRKGKDKYSRGAPIEAMNRPNPLSDLIPQQLDREARFVAVQAATMDEQPGRLVDGDELLVPIEDGEHVSVSGSGTIRPRQPTPVAAHRRLRLGRWASACR